MEQIWEEGSGGLGGGVIETFVICSELSNETHVHGNGHDERYKCVAMQCQNIDNHGVRSYNKKKQLKRNKNPICDCYMDARKESRDTQKYAKMIIRRPLKQTIKQRSMCKNKSKHAIYKINKGFKSIIPKPEWCFTLP